MRPASADKEETQAPDRFSRDYRRQTKQSFHVPRISISVKG
jgi:hypothetical protein